MEERKLEAFAVISAMGPTYLWFQLFELIDLARRFGLDAEGAQVAVSSLAVGTGLMIGKSGLSPADIQNLVPVQPLGESEEEIRRIYQTKLIPTYLKLTSLGWLYESLLEGDFQSRTSTKHRPKGEKRKVIICQLTVSAGVFLALSFRHTSSMAASLSAIIRSASAVRQSRFFLPASSIASEQPSRAMLIRM
jgi:hypothetical protein